MTAPALVEALIHARQGPAISILKTYGETFAEVVIALDVRFTPHGKWARVALTPEEAVRVGGLLLRAGAKATPGGVP